MVTPNVELASVRLPWVATKPFVCVEVLVPRVPPTVTVKMVVMIPSIARCRPLRAFWENVQKICAVFKYVMLEPVVPTRDLAGIHALATAPAVVMQAPV